MFKSAILLCLVSVVLADKYADQQLIQGLYDHRHHLANGFNGLLQPLDPLSIANYTISIPTEFGTFEDKIHHASIRGLTSFNRVAITHDNEKTIISLHVPQIYFQTHYTNSPAFLGQTDGVFSATMHDIDISITASIINTATVEDVNVTFNINGKATNIRLHGVNGEELDQVYVNSLTPRLSEKAGQILNLSAQKFKSSINEQATEYINKINSILNAIAE